MWSHISLFPVLSIQSPVSASSSSFMSITVKSFTLEDDSFVAMDTNITNLFVEYSFLNF